MSGGALAAEVAGTLLETVVELARTGTAAEQADIHRALDDARTRVASLPALGSTIAALGEDRRRELAARAEAARRLDPSAGPIVTRGQRAFDAYRAARGGVNHDGTPTPTWAELTDGVRAGWEAAADAARDAG